MADPSTGKRPVPPFRTAPPDGKPEIATGVDIKRMTDAAIEAVSLDGLTYQRSGMLVGVVTVPDGPPRIVRGIKRASGAQTILSLSPGSLRERCSEAARWLKYDGRNRCHVPTLPPECVVTAMLGRGEWGGVRPLVSVATCPQLRPDGSVLQTPGYDEVTGILYWPSDTFPEVSDRPTIDDARGALRLLREVVCDFPFARPEHESAWVAGLLTMLARPAIDGPVPLIAVDATTAGTGKSRLVDSATRIAYGHDAARTAMPEDDDEMRKRITAIVLDGDPAVCIDNIRRPVNLPSLEAVLTSMSWKDRLLGASRQVTAPHRTTWWLTANNVSISGDLGRRALHVRLESKLERPEDRPESDFRHPMLLRWVDSERRRLVAAALTLLRAFFVAGHPTTGVRPWGSFEAWSAVVPAALLWAGAADPTLVRATEQNDIDPDRGNLLAVLRGTQLLFGARSCTSKELISEAFASTRAQDPGLDELREALENVTRAQPGKLPEHTRLGYYFRKNKGRVMSGLRLLVSDTAQHVARWVVETVSI